jgi:lipoprotein NlpD
MLGRQFRLDTLLSAGLLGALLTAAALLAGCRSAPNNPPVQDLRATGGGSTFNAAPLPGAENAGKPGYYTVQPGDTIRRIATANNRDWREIVRWNNLDNPDKIEIGQVVRVVPPGANAGTNVGMGAGTSAVAVATQTTPDVITIVPGTISPQPPPPPPPPAATPAYSGADRVDFIWPAKGPVLAGFDESKNKGLDIGGKVGDPIHAAADGRVIYAGGGLRGYGNLVILKHNDTFLTAYAHNQTILVKENQDVKKGQKIAEMGSSDADKVELHFEVRRSGKPVDPAQYLPSNR